MWTKKSWEMEFVQYFDQEMTFICPTPLPFLKNTLSPVILMVLEIERVTDPYEIFIFSIYSSYI